MARIQSKNQVDGTGLVSRVREALSKIDGVEEKRMFGGTAFMVNGKMCVSARDSRIMCHVDPDIQEQLIQKEGCRTMTMKGREYKGYIFVSEEVLRSKKDLDYWIGLALDFNSKVKK